MVLLTAVLGSIFFGCVVYLGLNLVYQRRVLVRKRLQMASGFGGADDTDKNASFGDRVLKPVVNRLLGFFAVLIPMDADKQEKLSKQLMQGEIRMSAKNYNAAVLLITLLCAAMTTSLGLLMGKSVIASAGFGLIGIYAGIVLCRFQLKSKIKRRQGEIYHQLPDALDLLSVSVAAGLGFDQALSYVVKKSTGALSREFDLVQREISLGRSRKEALERMADRCGSVEIQTFVSAINQADEMGASIKNVLQIQSTTIRETHKQNVEEKMQKLAIKMLIPMVLFIFPVLFIILLGPAVPSVVDAFSNMG